MAKDAGMTVFGSDAMPGAVTNELVANGIKVYLGEQDGEFLKARAKNEGWIGLSIRRRCRRTIRSF